MLFHVRPARILTVLVLIATLNVYVFASGALAASSKAILGRLVTTSNRPVMVNGGEAVTGTVILSGSQLVTSAVNIATVNLPNVGTIMIAPSSDVSVDFDAKSITVKVAAGDVSLTTAEGVIGKVLDAAGNARTANSAPAAPAGGSSAKNWGVAGVAIGSGAFIWALIAWNKANDADDAAKAAAAANAALAAQLAALRTCLAGQSATTPIKLCTSF